MGMVLLVNCNNQPVAVTEDSQSIITMNILCRALWTKLHLLAAALPVLGIWTIDQVFGDQEPAGSGLFQRDFPGTIEFVVAMNGPQRTMAFLGL